MTDPLFQRRGHALYYYQNDHLGTPQRMMDGAGSVVWEARYKAFGEVEVINEAVTNNLRFPGQYFDSETGLYHNFHRDYDPAIGRYVQSDPVGLDGGLNFYFYSGSSPIVNVDPLGLAWNSSQPGMQKNLSCSAPPEDNSECISNCLEVNYGGLYTFANAFYPFSGPSLAAEAGRYTTDSLMEPKITRAHYTKSSKAHMIAIRQKALLGALRGTNAVVSLAGAFSIPFLITANHVCQSRCG